MTKILFRTIFMYAVILISMKTMGKRQLGQMQMSEFITAIILSELAALPISDKSIPLLYCLCPLIVLISLEVILSYIATKSSKAQHFLESNPVMLIDKGQLKKDALLDNRITLKEVLVELRIAGLTSISQVQYMFLEPNGKFSVIPKAPFRQATVKDLNLCVGEDDPDILLIYDGKVNNAGLCYLSKTQPWLLTKISPYRLSEVLMFSGTSSGQYTLIPKNGEKSS